MIVDTPVSRTKWASIVSAWKQVYIDRLEQCGYPRFKLPIYLTELPIDIAGMSATTGPYAVWLNQEHMDCDLMIGVDRMVEEILPHEIAHSYVRRWYPKDDQLAHGRNWRNLCLLLGLIPSTKFKPNAGWMKVVQTLKGA